MRLNLTTLRYHLKRGCLSKDTSARAPVTTISISPSEKEGCLLKGRLFLKVPLYMHIITNCTRCISYFLFWSLHQMVPCLSCLGIEWFWYDTDTLLGWKRERLHLLQYGYHSNIQLSLLFIHLFRRVSVKYCVKWSSMITVHISLFQNFIVRTRTNVYLEMSFW